MLDNSVESVYSSQVNSSDILLSMSAIQPAITSLKHLLSDEASNIGNSNVLALSLLKYVSQLPYVSVEALEPLLFLSLGKVQCSNRGTSYDVYVLMTCVYSQATVKSKYSSLLSCASSGFHLLLDTALTDDISSHSLSEVGCYHVPTIVYVFIHKRAEKCAHAEFL